MAELYEGEKMPVEKKKPGRKPWPDHKKKAKIHITVDRDLLTIAQSTGKVSTFFNDAVRHYVKTGEFVSAMKEKESA